MKFTNKLAYLAKNETRNKTNIKKYNLLNGDYIFEATFKAEPNIDLIYGEYCAVGITGCNMGIYVQSYLEFEDAIKWCWWELENGEYVYKDIFMVINLDQVIKVKVVKELNTFTLYCNDILFETKTFGQLYDYNEETICVGVGSPYSDIYWFSGEIYDVKIYHDSIESNENLYLWYDFERNTHFKTWDKSGNGNHGESYIPELNKK
jgi:hypothetical protein